MKKQLAHITSISLLLIYMLSMFVGAYHDIQIEQDYASSQQKQTQHFKANENHFLAHTIPSENSSTLDSSSPQPTNPDDKHLLVGIIHNRQELRHNVTFKQYVENNNNILIAHRKKDIIYPFHYYW